MLTTFRHFHAHAKPEKRGSTSSLCVRGFALLFVFALLPASVTEARTILRRSDGGYTWSWLAKRRAKSQPEATVVAAEVTPAQSHSLSSSGAKSSSSSLQLGKHPIVEEAKPYLGSSVGNGPTRALSMLPQKYQDQHYLERQSIAEENCWAAALQSALFNAGAGYFSQDQIMDAYSRVFGGSLNGRHAMYAHHHVPEILHQLAPQKAAYRFIHSPIEREAFRKSIEAGEKAILTVTVPFGHAMTVSGYDRGTGKFVLLDPRYGEKLLVTWEYLVNERAWTGTTMIRPTQS